MDVGYIALVLIVVLVSMTLHEVMHGYMAYFLGDDTAKAQGRLTLNPIKHIDPFLTILLPLILAISGGPIFGGAKPVPFNPGRVRHGDWGAAMVALAGPFTNLLIAFMLFGFGVIAGVISDGGLIQASLLGDVVRTGILVNLGFFIFNMLPVPPLDGSRVLYAVAPEGARAVMEQVERYGIILILLIVVLGSSAISAVLISGTSLFVDAFRAIYSI